jgi:hypothetical protein
MSVVEINDPNSLPVTKYEDSTCKVVQYLNLGAWSYGAMAPIDTTGYDWIRAEIANVKYAFSSFYVDDTTNITTGNYYYVKSGSHYMHIYVASQKDRTYPTGVSSSTYDRVIACRRANKAEMALAYFNPNDASGDSFTFSASAGTITIDSGTFITTSGATVRRPSVGAHISIAGASNAANNGSHEVTAATDTSITVSSTLVDETSSVTMRAWDPNSSTYGQYGPDVDNYTGITTNWRQYHYSPGWPHHMRGGTITDPKGDALATVCNIGTNSSLTSADAYGTPKGIGAYGAYGDNASGGWEGWCVGDERLTHAIPNHLDAWPWSTHSYVTSWLDPAAEYTKEVGGGFAGHPGSSDMWLQGTGSGVSYTRHKESILIKNPPKWWKLALNSMSSTTGLGNSNYITNYTLVLTMHKDPR